MVICFGDGGDEKYVFFKIIVFMVLMLIALYGCRVCGQISTHSNGLCDVTMPDGWGDESWLLTE